MASSTEEYKVFWQHKTDATHGESEKAFDFKTAKAGAAYGNNTRPEIHHWVALSSYSFEQAYKIRS